MNRQDLERVYRDEQRPIYTALAARINTLLGELSVNEGVDIAQIEHRAKTVEGVLEKYDRKPYKDPLTEIKDFAGVRVITYYNDDIVRVAELIRREFDVDPNHSSDKVSELEVTEFGYRSLHLVVSLSEPRKSLRSGAVSPAFQWRYRYAPYCSMLGLRLVINWIIKLHLKLRSNSADNCSASALYLSLRMRTLHRCVIALGVSLTNTGKKWIVDN